MVLGHFGQTNISRLDMECTIEEEVSSVDPSLGMQRVRSICGTMMFTGDLAKKKIKVLSGGERARVLLAKLLAKPCNLLLLDEPTNHLDQESVESLTLELQNYPGAVVIVTHSEAMLREVATKLVVYHHGKVEYLQETYDDFLKKIGWEEDDNGPTDSPSGKPSRQEIKHLRAEMIIQRGRELAPMRKRMEQLEQAIIISEEKLDNFQKELIDIASSGDSKRIQEISQKLGSLKKRIDESFEELTQVTTKHDDLFAKYEEKLKELEA
jgi:ATP-binding cassette subfamily F protein 3